MQTILHVLAIAGVLFLFIWWGFHRRSGLLGFGYALLGSVVVLAAAFDWPLATLLAGWLRWPLLSVAVAGLLLVLLAWLLIAVTASRQAGARSVPAIPPFPQEMNARIAGGAACSLTIGWLVGAGGTSNSCVPSAPNARGPGWWSIKQQRRLHDGASSSSQSPRPGVSSPVP